MVVLGVLADPDPVICAVYLGSGFGVDHGALEAAVQASLHCHYCDVVVVVYYL